MTIREATAQAHRELGKTDEEIAEIFKVGDRTHPASIAHVNREIPALAERPTIDHIKGLLTLPPDKMALCYLIAQAAVERKSAEN